MKDWLLSLLQKVLAQKIASMFALLIPIQSIAVVYLRTEIAPHLSDPTGQIALVSICIATSAVLLALASYYWLRPKLKGMPFGVHKDIKTRAYYCSRCYLKDKKYYPLETTSNGWKCSICGQWKQDPNNPVIPHPMAHHWNDKP